MKRARFNVSLIIFKSNYISSVSNFQFVPIYTKFWEIELQDILEKKCIIFVIPKMF